MIFMNQMKKCKNGLTNLKRNKMTAVEWLFLMMNNPNKDQEFANKLFEQAKEMEKQQSYNEEEVKLIERLIIFYWVEYNSEHPNNLKEFELSKSILEKLKNK